MVTQLYGDVASRPTRCRRTACLSVARLQSAGAGSSLDTKRSALGAHLSVDTWTRAAAPAAAVSHIVKYKIPKQVDASALGASLLRQTEGGQRWLGRLGPTRSAAHPARPIAAPNHNISWSRRLLESLHAQEI